MALGQDGVETRGLAAFHVGLDLPFSEFDEFGSLEPESADGGHSRRGCESGVDDRSLKSGSVTVFLLFFFLLFVLVTFLKYNNVMIHIIFTFIVQNSMIITITSTHTIHRF
jgi:hypothetical protein